jgi:hypothetical protein
MWKKLKKLLMMIQTGHKENFEAEPALLVRAI